MVEKKFSLLHNLIFTKVQSWIILFLFQFLVRWFLALAKVLWRIKFITVQNTIHQNFIFSRISLRLVMHDRTFDPLDSRLRPISRSMKFMQLMLHLLRWFAHLNLRKLLNTSLDRNLVVCAVIDLLVLCCVSHEYWEPERLLSWTALLDSSCCNTSTIQSISYDTFWMF